MSTNGFETSKSSNAFSKKSMKSSPTLDLDSSRFDSEFESAVPVMSSSASDTPTEGSTTKAIEKQTAKIPSIVYLALAASSMAVSAGLFFTSKNKGTANFIGQWAPAFLMLGVYNKIVKTQGSDSQSPA